MGSICPCGEGELQNSEEYIKLKSNDPAESIVNLNMIKRKKTSVR